MFALPNYPATSLRKIKSKRFALALAALLLLSMAGLVAALLWVPWWQSVGGTGRVTVFSPMERPQEVDAQIPGRIVEWYLKEGDQVRKGQKLARLQDVDSKFLDPQQAARLREMLIAYGRKVDATRGRLAILQEQRVAVLQGREAALPAAKQRIQQSRERLQQGEQTIVLGQQNLQTDGLQLERLRMLESNGLRSRRDLELAEQSLVRSRTELERSNTAQAITRRDISVAELELQRLSASFDAEVAKVSESLLKAQGELAEAEAAYHKLRVDLSNTERRVLQQDVIAPRDGRVVRFFRHGVGESVKAGDPLCLIVPLQQDPAVELLISDFDAPLVRPGQHVRLLFDGFPGVPFTALPWAAVGTFGGRVAAVDAVDDGSSRYRVLVVPQLQEGDILWPAADEGKTQFPLRPGTQAQGWIMMTRPVPLYWELWRRLNAFPPVPLNDTSAKQGGKAYGPVPNSKSKDKDHQPKAVFKR